MWPLGGARLGRRSWPCCAARRSAACRRRRWSPGASAPAARVSTGSSAFAESVEAGWRLAERASVVEDAL
eukprot:2644899-Pyramimonas_sp.AAC.1